MMVKKKTVTSHSSSSTPKILPPMGGTDVVGMKPAVKGINNNYLYGGLVVALLGAGFFVFANPMLLGRLLGRQQPGAFVQAPPMVQPGMPVMIQGSFNPPVPSAWYVVTNQQGQQVASGSLGSNVSTFSTQIPATTLPNGSYVVTVSDTPPMGAAGGPTPGSMAGGGYGPTSATLQQGLTGGGQLGAATSGPESISLT